MKKKSKLHLIGIFVSDMVRIIIGGPIFIFMYGTGLAQWNALRSQEKARIKYEKNVEIKSLKYKEYLERTKKNYD